MSDLYRDPGDYEGRKFGDTAIPEDVKPYMEAMEAELADGRSIREIVQSKLPEAPGLVEYLMHQPYKMPLLRLAHREAALDRLRAARLAAGQVAVQPS